MFFRTPFFCSLFLSSLFSFSGIRQNNVETSNKRAILDQNNEQFGYWRSFCTFSFNVFLPTIFFERSERTGNVFSRKRSNTCRKGKIASSLNVPSSILQLTNSLGQFLLDPKIKHQSVLVLLRILFYLNFLCKLLQKLFFFSIFDDKY